MRTALLNPRYAGRAIYQELGRPDPQQLGGLVRSSEGVMSPVERCHLRSHLISRQFTK